MAAFDPNMFTTPFQLTKSLHRDVYPAIDPASPTLKVTGKVLLITGAAGGLGSAIAKAWAGADAKGIVLVGRDAKSLEAFGSTLSVPTLVAAGSVASESDVQSIFAQATKKFGHVDVVINTAGGMDPDAKIGVVDPSAWWSDFVSVLSTSSRRARVLIYEQEVHVRGTYNLAHHFIVTTGGKGTFINLVSLSATLLAPGLSSYSTAKIAAIRLAEYIDLGTSNPIFPYLSLSA
jgi:NAD(P)-dependent dehydrogenase (short-subunit alcohol dehydrogenase family)